MSTTSILIGTRKGAFTLTSKDNRKSWTLSDPLYLGHIIHHFLADPRKPDTLVIAAKTGHLGPTVFHSTDRGRTWNEATSPPAFPKMEGEQAPEGNGKAKPRAVDSVFWLTPGHASEPGVWYAGTTPPGLFRSTDQGATWQPERGFNEHPKYNDWTAMEGTPAGQILHSIVIDPSDPKRMYLGISVGGVFESSNKGKDWAPINKGIAADFLPDPEVEYGHDPHCIVIHPAKPSRLYQQNHCGIYRLDAPAKEWVRIGNNMPKEVGDIGFPVVVHPRNPDMAWVFPMDGTTVWPRTSPDGKPAVYVTKDGGNSWTRQDKGMPKEHAYFTVKRQAMSADSANPLGLYFGTSQGEVWASADEGGSWKCLVSYLPEIYSIAVAEYED